MVLNCSLLIMALSEVVLLKETSPTASGSEFSSRSLSQVFLCTPGSEELVSDLRRNDAMLIGSLND